MGAKKYYWRQVEAGKVSGSVNLDIQELVNQINISFTVPYKLSDGTEVYMSKVIIAISGNYFENAKEIKKQSKGAYLIKNKFLFLFVQNVCCAGRLR
ncbi:MAG: hypothetical protein E7208_11640 [Clostridium butyricum]|nr:hypothetical protein [Clostridium butyricum]